MTPLLAALSRAVVENWHRFHVSIAVWLGVFGVFLAVELPPAFWTGCPWETLSGTMWDTQSAWHPAKVVLALVFIALAAHILKHVPVAWLITVVVGGALALGIHLLLVKLGYHPAWL